MGNKKKNKATVCDEVDEVEEITGGQNSKEEAFIRLGNARLNAVMEALDKIEKLSNKLNYSYTRAQASVILDVLVLRVKKLNKSFEEGGPPAKDKGEWL